MKIVDVKGMKCPMPLIETKKALKELEKDETLKIIIDNETSVKNVSRFLSDNNIPVHQIEKNGIFELTVNKLTEELISPDAASYCTTEPVSKDNSYVVLMAKDRLGEGSDELGQALAGAMLNTLKSLGKFPDKVIFMNSGSSLLSKDLLYLKT